MKKIIIINIFACLAIVSLFSCKKSLDQFPADSIEVTQAFKTMADARAWNIGMYSRLRGTMYGSNMFHQDVQADQLNATLDFGNRNGNPHRWGQSFLSDDGALSGPWGNFYGNIANLNLALANLGTIPTTTPAEATELTAIRGNAFLARAHCYAELVKRFAKPYEPATANSDLGVPLVLTYDLTATPARATNKQVYDQILSDIAAAKSLLTAVPGLLGSTRFTIHTAFALEARVKLYQQDWVGARTAAETVISSAIYPLANTVGDVNAMWKTDFSKEVITQSFVSKPNELPNTNAIYLGLIPATGRFTPDFVPSQWVVDFYDNADFRKSAYFEQKALTIQGVNYSNIWCVNKYPGNPALFTGATTNYAHQPKMFRSAELYLISAEAGAREGAATAAAALVRLNDLRVSRGLLPLTGLTGAPLFQAVKDERFRELAFEGFRLFDLKRWHEGFTRTAPQSLAFIQVGSNYNTLSILPDNNQFVWGIPSRELIVNPSLATAQNPGW
jgi:starch-binding outer membrane protein, SusD/RagB family